MRLPFSPMSSPTGDPDPDSIAERLKQKFGDQVVPLTGTS